MAISIAITKRLATRFGSGLLPLANVKNELTNTVGMRCRYDSNGNVTYLLNAGQTSDAVYRYDPEPPTSRIF